LPSLSRTGRFVAFSSTAAYLARPDRNWREDVFVRDRRRGTTVLVSVGLAGRPANDRSCCASISASGRYVAFLSRASNLVRGDRNGLDDAFVRDLALGRTVRVSRSRGGGNPNAPSTAPYISADGRFVAFGSRASNLVRGDTNGIEDAFVIRRQRGHAVRVSVGDGGEQGNGVSHVSSISRSGTLVAFVSHASNLVAGDTNGSSDAFVRDLAHGRTTRVSVGSHGEQANSDTVRPTLSANGHFVVFRSWASNLAPTDRNAGADVYVRDRWSGRTQLVSVRTGSTQAVGGAHRPWISASGRYVVFGSTSPNLVDGDSNRLRDIFLHDRLTGTTIRVNRGPGGRFANGRSQRPVISGNGSVIAFSSFASNLVRRDTNRVKDVFVHALRVPRG
jgi:Tol biopolymer transport system component